MKRTIMLCAVLALLVLGLGNVTAGAANSGKCGDNLTWKLDDSGVLTISGKGAMYHYNHDDRKSPWISNTAISSVRIKEGVTSIGDESFYDCTGLKSVTVPKSVTSIGDESFHGCTGLKSVTIPEGVTSIGPYAFSDCTGLKSMTIPDSVTSIGKCAFYGCSGLTSVTLPQGIKSIAAVFPWCTGLTSVRIPESVTEINDTFYGCTGLTSVKIPESVTDMENAFYGCTGLTSVSIPSGVTRIGWSAFCWCTGLKSVTIPESVSAIGGAAFQGCSNLTSVTIPENVTSIGENAFFNCKDLTDVYYGGTDAQWKSISIAGYNDPLLSAAIHYNSTGPEETAAGVIQEGDVWAMRWKCTYTVDGKGGKSHPKLEIYMDGVDKGAGSKFSVSMTDPDQSPWLTATGFSAGDFVKITVRGTKENPIDIIDHLFYGYTGVKEAVLSNVSTILTGAFENCSSLRKVGTLDDSLRSIGSSVFKDCTSLQTIEGVPENLKYIGEGAFQNSGITAFDPGNTISEIKGKAFEGSGSLSSIRIPIAVDTIGENAFNGCQNMKDVYYAGNKQAWKKISIASGNDPLKSATIHYEGQQTIYGIDRQLDLDYPFEEYVFQTKATQYNPELAYMLAIMAQAAYEQDTTLSTYLSLRFKAEGIISDYRDDSTAAYTMAQKTLDDGSQLVLITIRGSFGWSWASDFNLGLGSELFTGWHKGFESTEKQIYAALENYLGGIRTENTTYVITGHSQGAAVGNLLAVKLSDAGVPNTKVYDYNFACPNVASGAGWLWNPDGKHNNIFNIGNIQDPVTYVPGPLCNVAGILTPWSSWGKYGRSRWFHPLTESVAGHDMDFYVEYLEQRKGFSDYITFDEINDIDTVRGIVQNFWLKISCPVDVIISDSSGKSVAAVFDNEPYYFDSEFGEVIILVNGDEKVIMLPPDDEYVVGLSATDEGQMTFEALEADLLTNEVIGQKTFEAVGLTKYKNMMSMIGGSIQMPDVQLLVMDNETGTPVKRILPDGSERDVIADWMGEYNEIVWAYDSAARTVTVFGPMISGDRPVLVAEYDGDGRMLGATRLDGSGIVTFPDRPETVRLFWTDREGRPLSVCGEM